MTAFADTSGLYALLVSTEESHAEVASAFARMLDHGRPLLTTNYVLIETAALLQRRIGMSAVRDLEERILPCFTVRWITESLHRVAWERFIRADRRTVSLVDCTSFELMQQEGIDDVLALDHHFADAGFRLLPALA